MDKLLDAADLVEVQDVQSLFAYLISWHARWGDEAGAGGSSASPFGTPVLGNKGSQSLAARTVAASIFQKPETPAEGSSALPVPSLAASPARVKKPDLNRKSSSQLLREQREAEKAAALAHISAPSEVVAAHLPPAAEQAEVRLPVPTTISATESDRIQISKEAADKEAAEKEMVEKRGLQAAEKAEKVKAEKEAMEAKEKEAKENEAAVKEVERVKEQMRREAQQRLKDAEAKEKEAAEKENLRAREAAEKAKAEEMARKKVGEKAQPEATVPPKAMKILGSPHHNVPLLSSYILIWNRSRRIGLPAPSPRKTRSPTLPLFASACSSHLGVALAHSSSSAGGKDKISLIG